MVPIYGLDVYERICRMNSWKDGYLPNSQGLPPIMDQIKIHKRQPAMKRFLERALRMPPGAWLENWEMQRKIRKLSAEQSDSPESFFAADYCKGHNLQHGQRTERVLRARLESLQVGEPV